MVKGKKHPDEFAMFEDFELTSHRGQTCVVRCAFDEHNFSLRNVAVIKGDCILPVKSIFVRDKKYRENHFNPLDPKFKNLKKETLCKINKEEGWNKFNGNS